jgi:hypothetical protein
VKQFYAKIELPKPNAGMPAIYAIEVHFQNRNIISAAETAKDLAVLIGHDEDSVTKLIEVLTKE